MDVAQKNDLYSVERKLTAISGLLWHVSQSYQHCGIEPDYVELNFLADCVADVRRQVEQVCAPRDEGGRGVVLSLVRETIQ